MLNTIAIVDSCLLAFRLVCFCLYFGVKKDMI